MFRVVIPARYGSSRLPGKALREIAGKPMVQWVYERACAAGAAEVLIATDDDLIISAAHSFGAPAEMTARVHACGTDRIAEVARARGWGADEIVVNVQGDEPLIPVALIRQVGGILQAHADADLGTLATPIETLSEFLDPNAVKVVTSACGRALYFSRAPIPYTRDDSSGAAASPRDFSGARRHIGIYAYRVAALTRLAQLPVGVLEAREKLEQLRALEHGLGIQVGEALERPGPDVNTLADLERVSALMARAGS